MLSTADLLLYEYEEAVLLSNRIFAVTNQGTYFVWDTSYDILLSPSLFVLNLFVL